MAEANQFEFQKSPELCKKYYENVRAGRHKYVADRKTCGLADCWSTYRILCERYGNGIILADCEDFACAHAGWLASQCYRDCRILVGLVPGVHVSHAIAGVERQKGKIEVIDPAAWAGMPETHYNNPVWRYLT